MTLTKTELGYTMIRALAFDSRSGTTIWNGPGASLSGQSHSDKIQSITEKGLVNIFGHLKFPTAQYLTASTSKYLEGIGSCTKSNSSIRTCDTKHLNNHRTVLARSKLWTRELFCTDCRSIPKNGFRLRIR